MRDLTMSLFKIW
uniref:Uncharacterized protein n=1 Tax=Anguilla anguilla TaxID=7936 RepID=A0A0E9SAU2_ANGAN